MQNVTDGKVGWELKVGTFISCLCFCVVHVEELARLSESESFSVRFPSFVLFLIFLDNSFEFVQKNNLLFLNHFFLLCNTSQLKKLSHFPVLFSTRSLVLLLALSLFVFFNGGFLCFQLFCVCFKLSIFLTKAYKRPYALVTLRAFKCQQGRSFENG